MYNKRILHLSNYTEEETNVFDMCVSESIIKSEIIDSMSKILGSIYEHQDGRWGLRLTREEKPYYGVVYNYNGITIWCHINRLNTNYTALTHLYNKLISLLKRDGIDEIFNFNNDKYNNLNVIRKMMKFVMIYKDELLSDKNDFYFELEEYCIRSWEQGQKYTKDFIKNYKKYIPESLGIESNDDLPGDPSDMFNGFDCLLLIESPKTKEIKKHGTQIKGVKWCQLREDGNYYVRVSMKIEKYWDVKFFVFYDNKKNEIFIFKNKPSLIQTLYEEGVKVFLFNKSLLCKPKIEYVK